MAKDDAGATRVRVKSMTREAAAVISLRLEPIDRSAVPAWEPGAHLDLVVPDGTRRQYSLCGDPGDGTGYRVAILREPDGRGGSEYIHSTLRVGDLVTVTTPRNHFALEDAPGYVFIAGGIGITPLLPMISRAAASGIPWHLYYYGRSTSDMAFLDELAPYADAVTMITKDGRAAPSLTEIVAGLPAEYLLYSCGPRRLAGEIRALTEQSGSVSRLRSELFAAPEPNAGTELSSDSFVVRLAESGLELTIPPERSILEVVLDAGIDVLHDCAEGICGSCETGVVSGTPDHRDHVLTDREKSDNACMMICVSRASCPVLVLSL